MSSSENARKRDMSQGFLRQRRNLLLISILVPLFYFSEASIEKVNFFGTIITLKKQELVYFLMFIFYGYFFLRYWQYYREEIHTQDIGKALKSSMFKLEMYFFRKIAFDRAEVFGSETKSVSFASKRATFVFGYNTSLNVPDEYISIFTRKIFAFIGIGPNDGRFVTDQEKEEREGFFKEKYDQIAKYWERVESANDSIGMFKTSIKYNIFRVLIYRVVGIYRFIIHQSYFTDYQFPFVLALISILSIATGVIWEMYY